MRNEYIYVERAKSRDYIRMLLEKIDNGNSATALCLLENDDEFRSLCDEHEACNEAIERLVDSRYDEELQAQFSELRARLEGELRKYVFWKSRLPSDFEICNPQSGISNAESP